MAEKELQIEVGTELRERKRAALGSGEEVPEQRAVFVRSLFEDLPGLIEIRSFDSKGRPRVTFASSVEEALAAIDRDCAAGCNVYVGIATRGDRRNAETGRISGGKDNLVATRAWFIDRDGLTGEESREEYAMMLRGFPIPPSLRVDSGGGEHDYWLTEDYLKLDTAERIHAFEMTNRGLANALGGDLAATDASRILRVPGTFNIPGPDKIAKGRVRAKCRLIAHDGPTYTPEDIEIFRMRGEALKPTPTTTRTNTENANYKPGQRHKALVRHAAFLRKSGLSTEAALAALLVFNAERCDPPKPENEVYSLIDWAERVEPGERNAAEVEPPDEGVERPTIFLTDQQLDTVADDAIDALVKSNVPPHLFMRSDGVVTVRCDEEGRAIVAEVGENEITDRLAAAATWLRVRKYGVVNAGPTRAVSGVVRARLERLRDRLPPLRGVTESPLLRADGSILAQPGYDPDTGLYYLTPEPPDLSGVPLQPTAMEIESALSVIAEMIKDFPFTSTADRATAIACYLTLMLREAIPGCVPAFLLDGPVAGTGKGLLADAITIAATGGLGAKTTAPDSRGDDEWRKRITAMLVEGRAVCVVDNVEQPIGSAALAAALTTEVWSDRILGSTRMVNVGNRATWVITGNNLRVRGDLPRRCVWCRLDAKLARPWTRADFAHPALLEWVRENRRDLLAAGFTLGRAWFAQGQPEPGPHVPLMGSFEGWRHVVGGTLEVAGVKEFLGNLDRLYATIDDDAPAWAAFLSAWDEAYGDSPITVADLIADLERDDLEQDGPKITEAERLHRRHLGELRETLPNDLATALEAESVGSRRKRFGKALSRKKETRFPVDEDGRTLRIVQDDTRSHKVARWRVSE